MNNLQERLVSYATSIYKSLHPIMKNEFMASAVEQIIRSSTSVGANYSEAQSARSYRDFHNKIKLSLKELQETEYWLRFLLNTNTELTDLKTLLHETLELL